MWLAIAQVALVAVSPVVDEADLLACERLSNDYAAAVDGDDPDGLAALFVPDGRWQLSGEPMVGRDAIRAYLTDFVARKTARTMHVTTNVRIQMTGADTASGTAYVVIYSIGRGEGVSAPRGVGIYRDRYVRTRDGWRFSERVLDRVSS